MMNSYEPALILTLHMDEASALYFDTFSLALVNTEVLLKIKQVNYSCD